MGTDIAFGLIVVSIVGLASALIIGLGGLIYYVLKRK